MAAEGKLYKPKGKGKSHRSGKDAKPSSRRRKHGHSAACESDSSNTEPTSEDSDSDNDSDRTERVMLSKENIRKSTPETWAFDTGASSPMTGQIHLLRNLESPYSEYKESTTVHPFNRLRAFAQATRGLTSAVRTRSKLFQLSRKR
ncbi:hypothetical protein E4U19_000555 [Claviceps sp. Clav32 group G5]|nr:hypothetical protein E4U19_000555 [Claviceps sp. Clav32 group G5]